MRILVLGGDGMMGHQLLRYLAPRHDVRVTLRQDLAVYGKYRLYDDSNAFSGIDIRSMDRLTGVMAEFRPEAVINGAGVIKQRQTAKESIPSLEINALLPHRLAVLCKACGARLIHMSTDCIFNGKKGNYLESDPSDAEDLYGKTKFLGEVHDSHCLTLRTSIIGRELSRKKSLLEWFLAQQGTIKGFKKAIYTGFSTLEMSRIIEKMLVEYPHASGLYHVSSDPVSKYDLLLLIKKESGLDMEIMPDDEFCCDRSLNSSRFRNEFCYEPPSWPSMIEDMVRDYSRTDCYLDETPEVLSIIMFKDKTLLITGGTGTFGNAVLRRFLETDVREIRVFSRDEKKQDDMRKLYRHPKIRFYIGDVRNENSLQDAMKDVDFVFQAAALKQVPSCEFFPLEALNTNAIGTQNVLNEAEKAGVKRVIVLSTDKAVYPINAMGISKAMMEKLAVAKSRVTGLNTVICCTRYGNVMASRGSVIPLFIKQIQEKNPVTVTDPNMTRFMMTIEDAVDLVLYAFQHGYPGDIFVQKAPACTIGVLAEALAKLLKSELSLSIIGTRHGEKLFETLLTREEMAVAEDLGGYYRVPSDNRDLNYDVYFSEGREEVSLKEDYNSHNTRRLNVGEMCELLLKLECVNKALNGIKIEI